MLSRSVMSNSLWLHGLAKLLCPWDFPGKNTGAGCHFPLQGIFPAQGSKPGLLYLLHWQVDSLPRQGPETLICVSWLVSHTHPPEVATAINATFPVRTPRHREVKSAGELPSRNVSIAEWPHSRRFPLLRYQSVCWVLIMPDAALTFYTALFHTKQQQQQQKPFCRYRH